MTKDKLNSLLKSVSFQKQDASLLKTDGPYCRELLSAHLAETNDLLNRIAGCSLIDEIEKELEEEKVSVTLALDFYSQNLIK